MDEYKIGKLIYALLKDYDCPWNAEVRYVCAAIEGSPGFKLLPIPLLIPIVKRMAQEQLDMRIARGE